MGSHLDCSLDLHCGHKGNFTRWQVEYLVQKPLGPGIREFNLGCGTNRNVMIKC